MTGSSAPVSRRRRVGLTVLAGLSVLGGLVWPEEDRLTTLAPSVEMSLQPSDPPTGPVEIVGVRGAAVWAEGRGSTVAVTLRNRSDRPVVAQVWWLLAEAGDPQPWVAPDGEGRPTRVTLPAGDTGDVSVSTLVTPPPGTWSLSLWAHASQAGRRLPSHGVNVTPSVRVLSAGSDLRRVSAPGLAAVSTLVPHGRLLGPDGDPQGPDALVTVQASTQRPRR